jgi:hypothetical protein
MTDYRIERNGTIIVFLSERSTQRASGEAHPKVGTKIAFRTRQELAEYVRTAEREGFAFEGKEFLEL